MLIPNDRFALTPRTSRSARASRSLGLGEGLGELLHVVREAAAVGEELHVGAVDADAAGRLLLQVLVAAERREAPVLGDDDLLPAWELVLRAAEGLKSDRAVWQAFG